MRGLGTSELQGLHGQIFFLGERAWGAMPPGHLTEGKAELAVASVVIGGGTRNRGSLLTHAFWGIASHSLVLRMFQKSPRGWRIVGMD